MASSSTLTSQKVGGRPPNKFIGKGSSKAMTITAKTTGPRCRRPNGSNSFSSDKDNFVKTVTADYKSVTGGSAFKNGILTRIVNKIKMSYLDGEHALYTLDELLKLSGQQDVSKAIKQWLENEELPVNPKVTVTAWADGKTRYEYKPPLACRNQQEVLKLLKEFREKAKGGILEEDILSSVPHGERVIKSLTPDLHITVRQDKKRVMFYKGDSSKTTSASNKSNDNNDDDDETLKPCSVFEPTPQLKTVWQSFSLCGYSDEKVEDVLLQNGLQPVLGSRSQVIHDHKKRQQKLGLNANGTVNTRQRRLPSQFNFKSNEHVQDLERYEYDQPL